MAKNGIKEAILIALFSPPSSNSQIIATNNTPTAIEFEAPGYNKYNAKDSQQVPTPYKTSSKSKLKKNKKQSHSESAAYSFKEDSKGKPIKHKKSDNSKIKSN